VIAKILFFLLSTPSILGISRQVDVTASLDYCPTIIITPENRIPPTGNNSLEIEFWIRPESNSTPVYTTTVTTNNNGQVTICPISSGLITNQYYDIVIKGLSHLRHVFPHQLFSGAGSTYDLRVPVLFAGDSHPTSDNYVNSLDISYEILNLYTSNLRADLNRDTIVNSLEFPTLISHLYQTGDN
jgi:hypothetical protein